MAGISVNVETLVLITLCFKSNMLFYFLTKFQVFITFLADYRVGEVNFTIPQSF